MSVGTLGRIEEFNPAKNDLESYTETLEKYVVANDATSEAIKTAKGPMKF